MKKHLFVLGILSIALFTGCKKNIEDQQASEDLFVTKDAVVSLSGQFVPGELLVKFKAGTNEKSRAQTLSFINGKVAEHILTPTMESVGDNQGVFLVNTTTDVFSAIARMKGESNIEFAEPNWIYTHTDVSNDLYYTNGSLWGMYGATTSPANVNGSRAGEAWNRGNTGGASTVFVGIIDEGAMYNHEDLKDNFGNPNEIAGDGVDNDGNGYVDDTYGWDFVNNDNSTFDGVDDDHGTHVAGTIGAKGGNSIGVAGVSWNVKMISAKFLGTNGGTTANAIKSVDYITGLRAKGLNMVASNNSWGGGGFSQALKDAITRAENANILFIAAAGNNTNDNDASASYPASYTNANIIAVASITSTGAISGFSNFGATSVDIGAPGSAIYSTLPARSKGRVVSSYGSYSGTSMATPHVTGGAALYAASHSTASAATIKSAIMTSSVPTASLNGKCVSNGRLNVSSF